MQCNNRDGIDSGDCADRLGEDETDEWTVLVLGNNSYYLVGEESRRVLCVFQSTPAAVHQVRPIQHHPACLVGTAQTHL